METNFKLKIWRIRFQIKLLLSKSNLYRSIKHRLMFDRRFEKDMTDLGYQIEETSNIETEKFVCSLAENNN